MLYTEDFTMRHYVGFSLIGSHIHIHYIKPHINLCECNFIYVAYVYKYS